MNEPTNKPTGPQPPKEPPKPRKPRITWKVVQPKHYLRAQEKKASGGKAAYTDYVVSLIERFEGGPAEGLTKEQTEAVLTAFEEKFSK